MMALTSRPLRAYFRLFERGLVHCSENSHKSTVHRRSVRIVPVADEDNQGQAVTELVGTGGGLGRVGAGHFVQQPVRGRAKALLVLLAVEGIEVSIVSTSEIFFSISQQRRRFGDPMREKQASVGACE
jgi:hypothetical protein